MKKKEKKQKKAGKKKPLSTDALLRQAKAISEELNAVRQDISANEKAVIAKVRQKTVLEDELALLLKKTFDEEKAFLSRIISAAEEKQAGLKERISSLERITSVYEAKKAKVEEAKKRKIALEKELKRLNKIKGAWAYA